VFKQKRNSVASKNRPIIAVVEAGSTPRMESLRIASAFERAAPVAVLLCHWHCLQFEGAKVTVSGQAYRVTSNHRPTPVMIEPRVPVKGMFFYAPDSGHLTQQDATARDRLAAVGIDSSGDNVFDLVDRMMLEASRRGVVSNALGDSQVWGPKHLQELQLRRYELASGQTIARPKTYIARPNEFQYVLSLFARRRETCLVKPTFGQGGVGIAIVRPGEFCGIPVQPVVVQRLIPDPLLVEGNKADIRLYLLINTDQEIASSRVGPILVRRAAMRYRAESLPTEISNTAYRWRLGLPADVRLLETVPDIAESIKEWIVTEVNLLARGLIRAFFWNARNQSAGGDLVPNRRLLFGIDVLVTVPADEPHVYFLESNPFPLLFRGLPDCDSAIEEMLTCEYLPALAGSNAAHHPLV
jgi:Tubulin-tyrosine ligase family